MNRIFSFILMVVTVLTASAQGTPGIVTNINKGGSVTVDVPSAIVNRNNNELNKQATRVDEDKIEKKEVKTTTTYDDSQYRQSTTKQTIQGRKVGFRIQVLTDNSSNGKENVQARARAIAMKFPQYRTYISFNAPSWRLRIGDFKDQSEANAAMSRVRAAFPSYGGMSLVKDNVNVWSK